MRPSLKNERIADISDDVHKTSNGLAVQFLCDH